MNYSQLVDAIKYYTENTFGVTEAEQQAQINIFIDSAEQRIYNAVQLPAFRRNVTGNFSTGNNYLTVPNDWLSTYSLAVIDGDGNYNYLLNKDVNFIRAAYPSASDSGLPEYYSVFDENSFLVAPTPDQNYQAELHYFYYPPSIVTAGTSWLGDNFDTVLLYGTLLEAHAYMKGETDVLAQYQKRYDDGMRLLKQLGDAKDRQDAYRSGQVRYPVE